MPDITTLTDIHALIGSSAFLPATLAYVRNSSSGNLPLDPGIFQAILQCMVAGDKSLILLTPEEDVALVVKLAVWTLSSIFDLPTHKAKIRSRTPPATRSKDLTPPRDPNLFLRSVFLPSNKCDHNGNDTPRSCHARTRSRKRHPSFMRPASAPNDPNYSGTLPSGTIHHNSASADAALDAVSPPLIIAAPQPRPFTHPLTEAPPSIHKEPIQPVFPRALVLSGLEHATVAEQVTLAQALNRRQVIFEPTKDTSDLIDISQRRTPSRNHGAHVNTRPNSTFSRTAEYEGTWNLPDEFILIHVCPWNSRERPKIHRTLLDFFSMSSIIFVQKSVRDALRALPFTSTPTSHSRMHFSYSNPPTPSPAQSPPLAPPRTPPALSQALPSIIRTRPSRSFLPPAPIVPKQLLPREFIVSLQKAARTAHVSPRLSLYLSDLFSAVRHHPKLDGTFLTAKSMNDANDIARAGRILGTDPTGGELLQESLGIEYEQEDEDGAQEGGSSEMYEYIASGSESITLNIPRQSTPPQSIKGNETVSTSLSENSREPLFLSEAAIARIIPRAVTHRIRVRDGPEDEVLAGAIFGATFDQLPSSSGEYGRETRKTVKDILVEILAEV